MHNKNSTSYRLIAFALALVLTLGLLPITPAKAATGNGNDLIVEVDTTGSSTQEMKMSQIANPTLMGRKNGRWSKSVSDWFAAFTDKAGNRAFGYCNDHSRPAPNNGRGATMTIKPSSMKGNVALKNVLFLGYDGSERGPNYAVSHLRKWCVSLYGPATVGDWSGLTDGEFQKATQLAFWMLASGEGAAKPQVSIEGQYGPNGSAENTGAFEYFDYAHNSSASARRVLDVAKGLYGYATWLAKQGYDFEEAQKTAIMMKFRNDGFRRCSKDSRYGVLQKI